MQASNIARVTQGAKYGVTHYEILAVMDSRTSEICRSMHGRIIPAKHLERQAQALLNAKNMAEKKNASIWQSKAYNGRSDKMPSNFGLPPYHFRCRTEAVPVWIDEQSVKQDEGFDGFANNESVKMRNTSPLRDDEVVKHIDKMGVERVLDSKAANGYHGLRDRLKNDKGLKKDIVKALNSITTIAPHKEKSNQLNAMSANGYFLTFDGNRIITAFKPTKGLKQYFKNFSITLEQEIIKRWWIK
ncbi:phage head morphogenesis protein%2C SPP1 gp7 family [Campylobacter geochelonis]|nr:phage head morphogenesis protein%2C SPP1 gp7 family [Campylobacter geochelonis]CZE50817.1 phage head morphogenesis protein%2C SPP1 gp7 family [Campylobacter geochelonis]